MSSSSAAAMNNKPQKEEGNIHDKNRLVDVEDSLVSDWKIVIITPNDDDESIMEKAKIDVITTTTYHVHKVRLASGPRHSEYFAALFAQQQGDENNNNFLESQDNTSRIEVNELEAKAFPELLYYIYTPKEKMTYSTETATALYSLAKRFMVKCLHIEVKKFCLRDMKHSDRCVTYYEHAWILQAHLILKPAAKFCRNNIGKIDHTISRLFKIPDPQFWLDLMNYYYVEERCKNPSLYPPFFLASVHIATFCDIHADTMSLDVFQQLTGEEYLPKYIIGPTAAKLLLDVESRIIGNNITQQEQQQQQQDGSIIGDGVDGERELLLSSLQRRCALSIAFFGSNEDIRELTKDERFVRFLVNCPAPAVVADVKRIIASNV